MKVVFDRVNLLNALTLLKSTCATSKTELVHLTYVYFDGTWAFTYSGQHLSRIPFESSIKVSAPLATLLAVATSGKAKGVSVTQDGDEAFTWKSGKTRAKLPTLPYKAWPITMDLFDELTESEASDEDQALATAVRAVMPRVAEVASPDDASTAPGVRIKINAENVTSSATDNLRAGIAYATGKFEAHPPAVISSTYAKVLKSSPVDGLRCFQSSNWFGLRFAGSFDVFTRQLASVDGVDYGIKLRKMLTVPNCFIPVTDELIEAVKSIKELGEKAMITIVIENGEAYLCGKSEEPPAELDFPVGAVTLEGEGPVEDARTTVFASNIIRLLIPSSRLFIASISDNPVVAIDGHGVYFIVAATKETQVI